MKSTLRTASVFGLACSMLVACDSDSSGSDSTPRVAAASDSVATDDVDQAAAEAALLKLSDFDPGWSEVPQSEDDEQAAVKRKVAKCSGSDQDSGIDFGGALATTGSITSPDGKQVIQVTVSFAPDVAAADDRMTIIAAPAFAACIQPIYEQYLDGVMEASGASLDRVTIAKLNLTPAGATTVAYRMAIVASNGALTQELYADLVVLQSGRALSSPVFQTRDAPPDTDDIEKYVALAASRLPAP